MLIGVGVGIFLLAVLFFWFIWKVFSPVTFLKKCDCGNHLFLKVDDFIYKTNEREMTEHSLECLECGKKRIVCKKSSWGIEVEIVSE